MAGTKHQSPKEENIMTLNRRSIKWLPKLSLIFALSIIGLLVVSKATTTTPEMDMYNTLQTVSNIKHLLEGLF